MKNISCFLLFLFVSLIYPSITRGESLEEESNLLYILNFNNRLELKRNFLNSESPHSLSFTNDGSGYYFYLGAGIIWFISDDTELDLTLSSGTIKIQNLYYENQKTGTYINDTTAAEYLKKSLFIDELFIENDSLLNIKLGKMNISNATDFVFNDYVFVIRTEIPLYRAEKRRLIVGLQYNTLDGYFNSDYKKSPFVMADISYNNRKRFRLSMFTSFLYDNDNAFGKLYQPFVEDYLIKRIAGAGIDPSSLCGGDLSDCIYVDSNGYLLWSGIEIDGKHGNLSYRLDLILNYGKMDLYPYIVANGTTIDIYKKKQKKSELLYEYLKFEDGAIKNGGNEGSQIGSTGILNRELTTRIIFGYTAFGKIGYRFFNLLEISPYVLFMSGENDLEKSGYLNSFVSVKSFITLSNIFFSGGLNETASSRHFSTSGVNGYGVINPGLKIEIKRKGSPFVLNTGFMKFYSAVKSSTKKTDYGSEFDFILSYDVSKFLQISCEVDYFIVGIFFDKYSSNGTINNPLKILLGLNLFLDNLD